MKYDCETGQITGNTQQFSVLPSIVNTLSGQTSNTYTRIALNTADSYKLTCDPNGVDIQLNTGNQYFALQGYGIETASFSNADGIRLTGTDYNFKSACLPMMKIPLLSIRSRESDREPSPFSKPPKVFRYILNCRFILAM